MKKKGDIELNFYIALLYFQIYDDYRDSFVNHLIDSDIRWF